MLAIVESRVVTMIAHVGHHGNCRQSVWTTASSLAFKLETVFVSLRRFGRLDKTGIREWWLVKIPDDSCFLPKDFIDGFFIPGVDPRYKIVKMVKIETWTKSQKAYEN